MVELVVGRIARAHGINGEVSVEVRTDAAELRFAPGVQLDTNPRRPEPLTVVRSRWHSGRLLVVFEGVIDRTTAESLRGTLLTVESSTSPATDSDEYWDHDLVGLAVVCVDGEMLGTVEDVLHPPGAPLLVVRRPDGGEALVPFAKEIVPTVDLEGRRVVVDPPEGLFDL